MAAVRLVLVAIWGPYLALHRASAAAATTSASQGAACPAGYYQSSTIVFECGGDSGDVQVSLCSHRRSNGIGVPAGVVNFQASAKSEADIDMLVVDPATNKTIVSYSDSHVKTGHETLSYNKPNVGTLNVTYSGDDQEPPITETVAVTGISPFLVELFLQSYQTDAALTLSYSYKSLSPCPVNPVGCTTYDVAQADHVVKAWSRWAQSRFSGDEDQHAWETMTRQKPGGTVPWSAWRCVWEQWPDEPGNASWQYAFHYIDTNADMLISNTEFMTALTSYTWTPQEIRTSVLEWSKWVKNQYTPQAAWNFYTDGALVSIPQDTWNAAVWEHYIPTDGELKVSANESFEYCDTARDQRVTEEEFIQCLSPHATTFTTTTLAPAAPVPVVRGTGKNLVGLAQLGGVGDAPPVPSSEEGTLRCPEGYYRSSAIVWSCSGDSGMVRFFLKPSGDSLGVSIPEGVTDFKVHAFAQNDMDIVLLDPATNTQIVSYNKGVINDVQKSGTYQGTSGSLPLITFSGDDRESPVTENLTIAGKTGMPSVLSFHNYESHSGTLEALYSYSSLTPCPATRTGCSVYNSTQALTTIQAWSRWAQVHITAEEAWDRITRKKPGGVVPYYYWQHIWEKWKQRPDNASWQYSFHFIDTNHNQEISEDEFITAFRLYQWTPDDIRVSVTEWSRWVQQHHTAEGAWNSYSNGASVIPSAAWALTIWDQWFPSHGDLKVGQASSFSFCDTIPDSGLTREEFQRCYCMAGCSNAKEAVGAVGSSGMPGWAALVAAALVLAALLAWLLARCCCVKKSPGKNYRPLPSTSRDLDFDDDEPNNVPKAEVGSPKATPLITSTVVAPPVYKSVVQVPQVPTVLHYRAVPVYRVVKPPEKPVESPPKTSRVVTTVQPGVATTPWWTQSVSVGSQTAAPPLASPPSSRHPVQTLVPADQPAQGAPAPANSPSDLSPAGSLRPRYPPPPSLEELIPHYAQQLRAGVPSGGGSLSPTYNAVGTR